MSDFVFNYISVEDYQSDSDDEHDPLWSYSILCKIFEDDEVKLLKLVLNKMSPERIYMSLGYRCFASGDEAPFSQIRCFKYLIKRGLSIDCYDFENNTPLVYACVYNNYAIPYLLKKGANPNIRVNRGDNVICRYMRRGGKDIEILKSAFENGLTIDNLVVSTYGSTIFHISGYQFDGQFLNLLDFLISKGFDINARDLRGNTFLHDRGINCRFNIEIMTELYNRGFNFDIVNYSGRDVISSFSGVDIRVFREHLKFLKENDIASFCKEPVSD